MAMSEEELKPLLVEVGSKLQKPPTSVKELLLLLDRVEVYLSRVEQSPSKEIHNALAPIMKALVGDELLRHADVDVRTAVAACISEITRITAPDVPYVDDQMKDVFQLIVSSFESLADMSSQSYNRRTSILETVDKVRSSVVMLDLECDGLILEMFRHFINAIRDYHPENIYSSMESIMTRVIDESEEIPFDLLFCILDTVIKDKKEVTPIAQKLMKNVIKSCADKLKPCIEIAIRTKGVSLADYDEVVSLICNGASTETVVQSEQTDASAVNVVDVSKPIISTAETVLTAEDSQATVDSSKQLPTGDCSELVNSNDNAAAEADTLSGSGTLKDSKTSNVDKASETVTVYPSESISNPDGPGVETDANASETIFKNPENKDSNLDNEKVIEGESPEEPKVEKITKKRGRKAKAKKKASEPKVAGKSSSSMKQLEELPESHKSCSKDIHSSPKESLNEVAKISSRKPSEALDRPSKEIYGESDDKLNGSLQSETVISSSKNDSLLDEKITTSVGDLKEQSATPNVDTSELNTAASVVDALLDETNVHNDENLEIATTLENDGSEKVPAVTTDKPTEEREISAGKALEQVGNPSKDKVEDGPKTEEGIKKRGRGKGKATLQKLSAQAAVEDDKKEAPASHRSALKPVNDKEEMKETPKTSNKRKHIETNSNESKDYGEELVGSKVKVWWPADKRFYKGVIESFDSSKKKHKVLYADGEVENLFLKKQRWEVVDPDEDSDTDEETHQETPATEKRNKDKEASEGTSKKRLGRPPSSKSKTATNKPDSKPKDVAKSDTKSRDVSKGSKEKTDNSKGEEESKIESSKKLGRPRADASKSVGRKTTDEPSSKVAGKSILDESASEIEKSSLKGGDSKTSSIRGKSDSNAAGDNDTISIIRKDSKGKGPKSGNATSVVKSAGKSKTKEPSKSRSGSAAKEETLKALSDPKNEDISLKAAPKSDVKSHATVEGDPIGSEGEYAAEERTPSPSKAAGSSKRKASALDKGNKSGAKSEVKGKKGRKH